MKKLLLLLIALLPLLSINAQDIHYSPRFGVNLANLTNINGDIRPGVNVGFAVEVPLAEYFSVEPGVFYSMQGSKMDDAGLKINMDYVNIPIMAKYYIYEGFNLFVGPQFGFNVTGKMKSDNPGMNDDIDLKDAIKKFDFAINVGIGYQFEMGLNASLQYNFGLLKVFDDEGLQIMDKNIILSNSNNRVLQITLGWRF